ncbi:MAG: gamma-glutamylcyclotransferase [bacterium]|jgi:gamma-glutamylcyclotransferase (GGCT)/AIG2-like uncharacterized protein YtfP
MLFAVNGTLMRGLELNDNMLRAGAAFVREAETAPVYRLWSIGDRHPGMVRVSQGGGAVRLELWEVKPEGLVRIIEAEPAGLSVGRVLLADGSTVLGVLAEPVLTEHQREITQHGGWREYLSSRR